MRENKFKLMSKVSMFGYQNVGQKIKWKFLYIWIEPPGT